MSFYFIEYFFPIFLVQQKTDHGDPFISQGKGKTDVETSMHA